MEDLPTEIYFQIFPYLKDDDLLKLPLLNHYFNDLLHAESIWRNRIKKWIYNLEKPKQPITKAKYIEILRTWPAEIPDAKIRELPNDHDECLCLCRYHIYRDGEVLPCFEYIPIEVLALPTYHTFDPDLWVPLQYWFNPNPIMAIPAVAIPHGVRNINLNEDD